MSPKDKKPHLNVVTTTFQIPNKDILEIAYKLRADHLMKFGSEPLAWIISAQDYMCLIERLKSTSFYYEQGHYMLRHPTEFMGLPIRLKRTGPIELEIPVEQWHRFAVGVIE